MGEVGHQSGCAGGRGSLVEDQLEQEEGVHHHKGLILDPHSHHHHQLHLYKQVLNQETEEKEETREKQIGFFHGFHQNHHQLQQDRETPFLDDRGLHGGVGAPAAPPPRPEKKRPFSSSTHLAGEEYAPEKMGESYQFHNQQLQQHQQQQHQASGSSRLRTSGGEIVEVQGGHIVRSTGRKDRHSKVCTAKGPRDRRVRLSAHTAIQFYDVQDRLGYDRPSKAVDWLIKKAKTAIDELAELPAWKPTTTSVTTTPAARTNPNLMTEFEQNTDQLTQFEQNTDNIVDNQLGNSQNSSFLPPSLDSDSIADTIKSFFPMGASSNPHSNNNHHHHSNNNNNDDDTSGMQFHQSFPPPELISRAGGRSQDLRLSLQSFQDPMINHHHHQQHHHHHHQQQDGGGENNNMYFDGSGWPDNPTGGYQRMVAWGGDASGVSAGFIFGSSPATAPATATAFLQPLFGQPTNNQLFTNSSQRGPLQSSTTPSFRAWIDPPPPFSGVAVDQHPTVAFHHQPSVAGFNSGLGGFTGFRVPARFQGEPEEHDGISDRPSSASSDSHH